MRGRVALAAAALALTVLAVVVRVHGLQPGLLYPDGYQYLLMARGIGAHLTPSVRLGHGGELFVPSVDASLKPLFPALVAALSPLGGARAAADAITVAAGVATVGLTGALAGRLTRSHVAAAAAAGAALASPALGHWSGFTGPDPLAGALALAAALAVLERRGTVAGVLGALCAATRPEWGLLLAAAALAGLARPASRPLAHRALVAGAFTLAAILALIRPPLAAPNGGLALLLGALVAGTLLLLAAGWAAATPRRATAATAAVLGTAVVVGLTGRVPALAPLVRSDWPLLAVAAWGAVRACREGRGGPVLAGLAAVVLLGTVYAYRNPGSERYLAQLLPLACVAVGLAAAPVRAALGGAAFAGGGAVRVALPVAAIALVVLTVAPSPRLAPDTFATLAGPLSRAPAGTLVSAAPDAYGYLLPGRSQRTLRAGARGLILLDAAQRTYSPGLTACGTVVATLPVPTGFTRPDGTLDSAPAVLVDGRVVAAHRQRCGAAAG